MPRLRGAPVGFGIALAAALLSSGISAQTRRSPQRRTPPVVAWTAPEFIDVSVHDPSVLTTDGQYYIFGSHLASAKSADLMQWELVSDGVSANNPLFDNVLEELAETFAWAESNTLWAPDVIQLEDGNFYMYYDSCRGDSPRSAMGVAVSENVEGPYSDRGIFLKSGMWGMPSEDGSIYDARVHPNTVDPDTFFDADGRLWTVYGSYSGGIFILETNPSTGFPFPGQGYGLHLMGGNHSRIEGPYVLYSPDSGYYYLFTSFGGLAANGGYNIRVARATSPEGPYFDSEGYDMSTVKSDPSLPLFDDASIEPYGVKLMGSHLFEREVGEEGTGPGTGYVSPGHNSAYYDERTGRYFLIFHTRFPGRGEFHQVRVHEMFINEDGWPVVAPHRFAPSFAGGEMCSEACDPRPGGVADRVPLSLVPGNYKMVNHGKAISPEIVRSTPIELHSNGQVSGSAVGSWGFLGHNRIALTIDGTTFSGVLSRQWNETLGDFVVTFSALSRAGVAIWGTQLPHTSSEVVLESIISELSLGDTKNIAGDIALPAEATRGAVIAWESSNPALITNEGVVTRPETGEGSANATLTATVDYQDYSAKIAFEVTVLEMPPEGMRLH